MGWLVFGLGVVVGGTLMTLVSVLGVFAACRVISYWIDQALNGDLR
jgi:hypothetical protein